MPSLDGPLDLSQARDLSVLAQVVAAIRDAAPTEELLLIGAQARDVLLGRVLGMEIKRGTRDIDFALAVTDWTHFSDLRRRMLASGRFHAAREPNRLHFERPGGPIVDVVPFGGVEESDRSLAWPPDHEVRMSAIGFSEALRSSIAVALPGGVAIQVVSPAAFAALKLFAWSEREPRLRGKDASDLALVVNNYQRALPSDAVYDAPDAVRTAAQDDPDLVAAWLLGRHIAEVMCAGNVAVPESLRRLSDLLRAQTDEEGRLSLPTEMGPTSSTNNLLRLRWMRAGLDHEAT